MPDLLLEHRTYTLHPGCLGAFWDAQAMRGFDPMLRGLGPLLGWFGTVSGSDQIVILFRFGSYEEWETGLQTLYDKNELQAYFTMVRKLMKRQQNKFLRPAPVPELTPFWGNGRDHLPSRDGPLAMPSAIIEETTIDVIPGQVPQYWQAYRDIGAAAASARDHLLGCFVSNIGPLNQILRYRAYAGVAEWAAHKAGLEADKAWREFEKATFPLLAGAEAKLITPSPHRQLVPLFRS